MTAASCATPTENIWLIHELMQTVKPEDLSDDELVAMVEILKAARDRKPDLGEQFADVVDLDLVRSGMSLRGYRCARSGKPTIPNK